MNPSNSNTKNPARKPRILWANFFCLLDRSSGASIAVREMLRQLAFQGWEVAVLGATVFDSEHGKSQLLPHWAAIDGQEYVRLEDAPLLHHTVVTARSQSGSMTVAEINRWHAHYTRLLEQFKPDLVFFYGGQAHELLIADEARARRIPVAAYMANGNYHGGRWCRDVDLVLTDSQATAGLYKERLGIEMVPCGTFIDPVTVIAPEKQRKNLLFVNPSLEKGVGIVVQLALLLERRQPDIVIEIVESRGNWQHFSRQIAGNLGHADATFANVVVTPNTPDMRPLYGRARVLLAPSLWWESGGRVAAEALLNGIPAVITNRGGLPEFMGGAGMLLNLPETCHQPPYDILPILAELEPLADWLVKLYDDEQAYAGLSQQAFIVGQTRHNIGVNTMRLISALKPLTDRRAGDLNHRKALQKANKHPHLASYA